MRATAWTAARVGIAFVVPMLAYYALRAAGLDVYLALLVTSVVPAAFAGIRLAVHRRTDGLATFMTVMMLLGAAVSLINGDERLLMAREGWVTAVAGIWFLGSAWTTRPLAFLFARPLLDGRIPFHGRGESWDELWSRLPRFRRIWRVATVTWGVGTLIDATARVVMAYTLPPDAVPALHTALYAATTAVLFVSTNAYYVSVGLFDRRTALYAPLDRPPPTARPNVPQEMPCKYRLEASTQSAS